MITGISLRTSNDDDRATRDIPSFWQRFYEEKTVEKIKRRVSDERYAVYTHFENEGKNNRGMYTMIIGCAVDVVDPADRVSVTIPEGRYAVFTCQNSPASMVATWQKIWQLSVDEPAFDKQKTYYADYEHYLPSGEVNISIGLHTPEARLS